MEVKDEATVTYPVNVLYCGVCGLPPEYCEYGPSHNKCKLWLVSNHPELAGGIVLDGTEQMAEEPQPAVVGKPKKGGQEEPEIVISTVARNKRKHTTSITGLGAFGISLTNASKTMKNKFACGASVTKGKDEIVIQGDVQDDLYEIVTSFKNIPKDSIYFLQDGKKVPAGDF